MFMLARAVTCISHNTCLHRPQHLFTSANTGTCVGHIIVPATGRWHSWIPRVPGIRPARHSVMALCATPRLSDHPILLTTKQDKMMQQQQPPLLNNEAQCYQLQHHQPQPQQFLFAFFAVFFFSTPQDHPHIIVSPISFEEEDSSENTNALIKCLLEGE